jgi:chain length determinant protein EpsF
MSLQQFLLIIRGRWRVVTYTVLAAALIALAAGFVLPTRYTASASVLVDVSPDPVAAAAAAAPAADFMQTQEDIASSDRVARRVVQTLRLEEDPDFQSKWRQKKHARGDFPAWIVSVLHKSVSVPPVAASNVLTIFVKWPDAKFAATLANAFAQAYIDTTIELKMQPAQQYAKLFDESARSLRADLEAKQKLLADYENSHGIVVADERLDSESARQTELSTQLVAIQAQLQESQSRQRPVSAGDAARPEVLQNALIASLQSELSRAEAKQQNLATSLGTNHPDYLRNEAEIRSLRDRIDREGAKIVASLGSTTQVNQRRASDLSAALEAQKQRVLLMKHQRDEGTLLQNDVLTAQRNLDAVTQRLAQSNLQTQTPQSNIALLTPATEPAEPSNPNFLMNVVMGIVFGTIIGVAIALLLERGDPRIRSDSELLLLLGLPLLGKLKSVADVPENPYRLMVTMAPHKALKN